MPGKIFCNYRRDDARDMAARVRDRLAQTFGNANVFMDVDHLLAGQRFDRELERALAQTDVLVAVIGPRWMDLLGERTSSKRDYVREEIAGALKRGITVIPVVVERTPLPDDDALPDDIRELVLHQKHVVTHEQFGRDVAGLIAAIQAVRRAGRSATPWWKIAAGIAAIAVMLGGAVAAYQYRNLQVEAAVEAKRKVDEAESQRLTMLKIEEDRRAAVEAKHKAEEAERQRLAMLKAQEDAKRAEEAKRKAEEEAARRDPALSVTPGSGAGFRDCPDCPEMVVVPAGEFMMGPTRTEIEALVKETKNEDYRSDGPQRRVVIARPFAVGKFEVTFAEWDACVVDGGCKHRPAKNGGRQPVFDVSWNDITKDYLPWLSRKTGKIYRLPSQAEWEYAARAGTTTLYSTGNTITPEQANFRPDFAYGSSSTGLFRGKTVEVGSFAPNAFGLYDVHGSLYEWAQDCGSPSGGSASTTGNCNEPVLRGGSWRSNPRDLRSASRRTVSLSREATIREDLYGFRVVRTLD